MGNEDLNIKLYKLMKRNLKSNPELVDKLKSNGGLESVVDEIALNLQDDSIKELVEYKPDLDVAIMLYLVTPVF